MLYALNRALPPAACRPGLLQVSDVVDHLSCRRNWRVTAEQLAEYMERPLDQVLHVLSYMTSLGLLSTSRHEGAWYYMLEPQMVAC